MSEDWKPRKDMAFPVAGIGASAGGLEALLEIFPRLPKDPGFAYIVLLDSSSEHQSHVAQILSGHTLLPVREADKHQGRDQRIEANHGYVVPPGIFPGFIDGRLVLLEGTDAGASRKPIDHLFRSMAATLGARSIGVVLSGTGSDGALGIQAIKAHGGRALIQDPDSALFDSMPRNALAFGGADFIGSPAEIAEKLAGLGQPPLAEVSGGSPPAVGEDDLDRVLAAIRAACGIDFSHYKRSTIHRRLARRLALKRIHDLEDYLKLLNNNPAEATALSQDFLIQVTGFFREPDLFQGLIEQVFPRLVPSPSAREPIRIWVPACSTGEEVYSIAIALLELLGERAAETPIMLFGTDLSGPAIEQARAGLYAWPSLQGVSPERLKRYFTQVGSQYQISPAVRDLCVFAQHNVARDPPFSKLNLISCCNLLIYFGPILQRRVTAIFHYALKPGGFLVLGPSESISPQDATLFSQIDKRRRIYLRKNEPRYLPPDLNPAGENPMNFHPLKPTPKKSRSLDLGAMQEEVNRLILQHYAPAGLVIDEQQNVVQFSGDVGPFLEPQSGPASLNLARLVQPALLAAISSAVDEARAGAVPLRRENVRFKASSGERHVHLDVVPLRKGFEEGRYFLVLFEEGPAKPRRAHAKGPLGIWPGWLRGRAQKTVSRTDPARLECELDAARNHLRAIFTAYESVQEELKSSREKLRSAQEEFQSANEELDTAKEELQAANEELVAANTELQLRNQELSRINADLREARDYAQAIVDTTQDALLVLDPELKVRRANRAFLELFRVPREAVEHHLLSDVGQGVWSLTGLLNQIRRVALGGEPIENLEWTLDIPSQGSWILVSNACRLVGEANLSGLVLLSIRDVTEQRSAEAMLKQQADLLDQAHEAILIWTLGGAIRYWNRGAEELYGWRREEALGKVSHALLKMRTGISYEEFIRKLRADGQWIGESVHTTRSGEELVVESHRTVQEQSDGSWLVFETNRDITKRKQMEQSLLQADRQKDEFLAMLAHELRNPLAPLRNALSILHRSNPNQLPIEKLLTMMDRQVLKLARIVDDLLDAARITRGQIELRKERVDLAVLINHAIEPIKPQLKALTQKLSVALPKTPVLIEADPIRVEQVIENLLSNAVKYTPPGGRIGIALETIDDRALVRVDDNGKGIGPDVLPKVFDLFIQADHGLDRQPGGLGIGLTLVRRLVELHGGSVEASSAGPGLGSQFIVKLPLATITEPPDPTPPKAPSGRLSALDSPA